MLNSAHLCGAVESVKGSSIIGKADCRLSLLTDLLLLRCFGKGLAFAEGFGRCDSAGFR